MKKLFTVWDAKAEFWLYPFASDATGLAVRSFETCVNDEKHEFNRYASDYTLFEIGEWDQLTCYFHIYEVKINLGNAIQFLKTPTPQPRPAAMTKPNGGYSVPVAEGQADNWDHGDLNNTKGEQE